MVTCSYCPNPPDNGFKSCESCRVRRRAYKTTGRQRNPPTPAAIAAQARYRAKRRREVIEGYGGECACCKEAELAFLTIDHVNGGGHKHRKTKEGHALYTRLRAALPERDPAYQVLCWNCNSAKHFQGACPHTLR